MREYQSKLLMIRRFLMSKSNAKLKVRDNVMTDGTQKFTWVEDRGLIVLTGVSLDIAMAKYNQTVDELEIFLTGRHNQTERETRSGAGSSLNQN